MIRAAIIGISGYGRSHLNMLLEEVKRERARIVGATVIDQREQVETCALLRGMGCEIFDDYEEMLQALQGRAEFCMIPTPIHLHAPMSIAAMQTGFDILVEKPFAATIQDVRSMREVSRSTGRMLAVGFQTVYASVSHQVKKLLLDGAIGDVTRIKACAAWRRPHFYYARNAWAGALKAGELWVLDSPINNAVSHYLHLMLFLLGESLEETAFLKYVEGETFRAQKITNFDTGVLRGETESGVSLLFCATHSCLGQSPPQLVVEGTAGCVRWSVGRECVVESNGESATIADTVNNERRTEMMDLIFKRLETGSGFICDGLSGESHTLCVNGLYESSPIQPVPEEYLFEGTTDRGRQTAIKDIDRWVERCFQDFALFSEAGCPWAQPGARRISLADYDFFPSADAPSQLREKHSASQEAP